MALTSTEQVALRALQEALAKVMDAQTLCVEAQCTGDQVVDNLLRAEGALVQAIRAFDCPSMTPEQQHAALADIARRHSTLHDVDKQCAKAMKALCEMVKPCSEHGLNNELQAVHDALCALHSAAKLKWNAT